MLNRTTLARPYARAAFEAAQAASQFERWSDALGLAAEIAGSDALRELIGDPRIGGERLLEIVRDVGGAAFDESFINFLKVVIVNGRLELLPEMAVLYEQYRREAEAQIRVDVRSARPMDEEQSRALAERLKARFGRDVELHVEVDESLIGGAIIRAGDQVIDGSVRGRLEQLSKRVGA